MQDVQNTHLSKLKCYCYLPQTHEVISLELIAGLIATNVYSCSKHSSVMFWTIQSYNTRLIHQNAFCVRQRQTEQSTAATSVSTYSISIAQKKTFKNHSVPQIHTIILITYINRQNMYAYRMFWNKQTNIFAVHLMGENTVHVHNA